jgi:hypothetical protein
MSDRAQRRLRRPSLSRQTANSLAVFDVIDWTDTGARSEDARLDDLPADRLGVLGVLGVLVSSPLALVVLGGILNAV